MNTTTTNGSRRRWPHMDKRVYRALRRMGAEPDDIQQRRKVERFFRDLDRIDEDVDAALADEASLDGTGMLIATWVTRYWQSESQGPTWRLTAARIAPDLFRRAHTKAGRRRVERCIQALIDRGWLVDDGAPCTLRPGPRATGTNESPT